LKEIAENQSKKAIIETQDFMEMKSNLVMSKPRLQEYIHELTHQPIDMSKVKNKFEARQHARIAAKSKSRKTV